MKGNVCLAIKVALDLNINRRIIEKLCPPLNLKVVSNKKKVKY